MIKIVLVLDFYLVNKKWNAKLREVKIDESLINSNLNNWQNFCIVGIINNKYFNLIINEKFIKLDFNHKQYKVDIKNYSITAEKIEIEDCVTIYKKENNIKLTISFDEIVFYLDFNESNKLLLEEGKEYFLITKNIKINTDSFIYNNDTKDKEDISNTDLILIRYNRNNPIYFKVNNDIFFFTDNNMWNNLNVNKWILYEDFLVYSIEKDNKLLDLKNYNKYII